jgi:cytochrome bd ubiquinol oxidase subunit I
MEGLYETKAGAPLVLFGWPDSNAAITRYAVEIPKLGSLILTHDWNGTVKGLNEWPKSEWPNAPLIFWTFRIMVGIGFAMLGLGLWSLYARWRGGLIEARMLQRAAIVMGPSGFAAVLAGWITTEAGRQPYTVYGLLRTADSVSPIAAPAVASSLIAFMLIYLTVFGAGTYYILRLMAVPPKAAADGPDPAQPVRAAGINPGPAQPESSHASSRH